MVATATTSTFDVIPASTTFSSKRSLQFALLATALLLLGSVHRLDRSIGRKISFESGGRSLEPGSFLEYVAAVNTESGLCQLPPLFGDKTERGSNLYSCAVLRNVLAVSTFSVNAVRSPDECGRGRDTSHSDCRGDMSIPNFIKVSVFGGSVSCAGGVAKSYALWFADFIYASTDGKVSVHVNNYCTPAAGPSTIHNAANCGFDVCSDADLIISEFSLNAASNSEAAVWYSLLQNCSTPIVIVNLFSWLYGGPVLQYGNPGRPASAIEAFYRYPRPHSMFLVDFTLGFVILDARGTILSATIVQSFRKRRYRPDEYEWTITAVLCCFSTRYTPRLSSMLSIISATRKFLISSTCWFINCIFTPRQPTLSPRLGQTMPRVHQNAQHKCGTVIGTGV